MMMTMVQRPSVRSEALVCELCGVSSEALWGYWVEKGACIDGHASCSDRAPLTVLTPRTSTTLHQCVSNVNSGLCRHQVVNSKSSLTNRAKNAGNKRPEMCRLEK